MSSLNAPSLGASESGSSRRHSMETSCHPAAVRCPIISELNGPEITSRIRSKCAIEASRYCCELERSQFGGQKVVLFQTSQVGRRQGNSGRANVQPRPGCCPDL